MSEAKTSVVLFGPSLGAVSDLPPQDRRALLFAVNGHVPPVHTQLVSPGHLRLARLVCLAAPLLECMTIGVVAVMTAVAAIQDVMQDGKHGYLIPARNPPALADAIARLDADRSALQRMSRASQQRIQEDYTLERMANEFRVLYQTL